MRDEELRALEQAAARGDPEAAERLLRSRHRAGEISERLVDLAAYVGFAPALSMRPGFEPLASLRTETWVDGLGRFGRGASARSLLALARELSPEQSSGADQGERTIVPIRPAGTPERLPVEETLVIGRSRRADLRLDDERVSRRHCELRVSSQGEVSIRDLQSTNGTFLAGVALDEETPLRPGQLIRVGRGALLQLREGLFEPTLLQRCFAAIQVALDDPCSATARAVAEVVDPLRRSSSSPREPQDYAVQVTLAAAYSVAGRDVLAGAYVAELSLALCQGAAQRALLPWILSGASLPPDPPEFETEWSTRRLAYTTWPAIRGELEAALGVCVWAPLGDCDPRRHARFVVQSYEGQGALAEPRARALGPPPPSPLDATRTEEVTRTGLALSDLWHETLSPSTSDSRVEVLHVVNLQGLEPRDLPPLEGWIAVEHAQLAKVSGVEVKRLFGRSAYYWCAREAYAEGVSALRWVAEARPSPRQIVAQGASLARALTPLLALAPRWRLTTLTPEDIYVHEGQASWRGLVARTAISALEDSPEQDALFRHRELHVDLRYLSPEQARDSESAQPPRVLVYQFAAILYTLLAERPPFPQSSSPSVRVLLEVLDRPAESLVGEGLDPDLDALLLRCLAKEAHERPASPQALAELLEVWLASSAGPAGELRSPRSSGAGLFADGAP